MGSHSIDIPLEGKIILITGGASGIDNPNPSTCHPVAYFLSLGIGLSLTKQAHTLGARGILVADLRTTTEFDTFCTDKPNIVYIEADVTQWADFTKIFDICEQKFNDVPDLYGICAGIFEPSFSNFWLDTEENGYKQVQVNVNHPIKLTRMAIKRSLGRNKRASVCIIASIAGLRGSLPAPLYCATKHAIVGFVRSMKDSETMTGVKITTICPGIVDTPLFDATKKEQFSFNEVKKLTPDEVARHMVDLLQKKDYGCGTVMELSANGPRLIPEWNISPPEGEGTGQEVQAGSEVMRRVLAPVKEKLASERDTGL